MNRQLPNHFHMSSALSDSHHRLFTFLIYILLISLITLIIVFFFIFYHFFVELNLFSSGRLKQQILIILFSVSMGMLCGKYAERPVTVTAAETGDVIDLNTLEDAFLQGNGVVEQITETDTAVKLLVKDVEVTGKYTGKLKAKVYLTWKVNDRETDEKIQGASTQGSSGYSIQQESDVPSANCGTERFWPGQRVSFCGVFSLISTATNPGAFDYGAYCKSLGIAGQIQVAEEEIQIADPGTFFLYNLWRFKNLIRTRLLDLAEPSDQGILIALLTGDKSELSDYWEDLYQEGGIVHLLTISGLHISILGMGFFRLLRKLTGSYGISSLISGSFITVFCIMAGMGTSMVRAEICFCLYLLAGCLGRSYDFLTAVSTAGFCLLWQYPLLLFQSGFLMTFSCCMGIGILIPLGNLLFIQEKKEIDAKAKSGKPIFFIGALPAFQKTILDALLIQTASLPAVLWFQGKISLASPLINLLTVPLMGQVLVSAILAVGVSFLYEPAGIFLMGMAHYILKWYEWICLQFQKIETFSWTGGRPHFWQIFLWIILLIVLLIFYGCRRLLWKHLKLPFLWGLLLFPCSVLLLQRWPLQNLQISFLDVGQGDGIVMELPSHKGVICIDGGSSSQQKLAEYVYEPYFAYAGIDKVDYWLITHPDSDHYSGMLELLKNGFDIEHILMPFCFQESELAQEIESFQEIAYIEAGDYIQAGKGKLEILSPQEGKFDRKINAENGLKTESIMADDGISHINTTVNEVINTNTTTAIKMNSVEKINTEAVEAPYTDANDNSAVIYLEYGDFTMLLTGDMGTEPEAAVLENLNGREVDVLKAAHHGSKYSTSQEFLEQIKPEIVVISCGQNNLYGHPHEETLKRLEEAKVHIWRTDVDGCIQIIE